MQTCPTCGFTQNRDAARFCSDCAAPLAPNTPLTCARCGAQNIPGARFCSNCASPLTSAPLSNMTGLLAMNTLLQSRYIITRKLGQGGMGAVYQAQDARLPGKMWAIKEMSDAQLADPIERQNAVAAFQREAQLLATLDHTNLPKVVDYFTESGKQYLVMDFIEGQTLEQIVVATPGFLPEPMVLGWVEQICNVLEYLHACQPPIIFRDLKPANIMLARDGKIKLIDFGIVRFFQAGKKRDTAAYGTMGYAAPEQLGTGQTDARSDIYSLGVTMYSVLTKFDPATSPFNLPPVRNINSLVSAQTEAVILCATKMSLDDRYQSIHDLRQSLLQTLPPAEMASTPLLKRLQTVTTPSLVYKPTNLPTTFAIPTLPGMIYIPAGEFVMGSNEDNDEKPPHRVYLDAYYIDRYPVTNAEYKEFVDMTRYRPPNHWSGGRIPPGQEDHPVVNVSWDDAYAYSKWIGKRLPTEAEWEKAATWDEATQTKRRYPWGDHFDMRLCNTSEGKTTPVSRYSPRGDSPYCVGDLVGNIKEWVVDWYQSEYYAVAPTSNPRGPAHGQFRVVRGGGWIADKDKARATYRTSLPPIYKMKYVGLRCARSV